MIMIKLKKIIIIMMKINSLMANMITLMKMIKVIRMKMMIVKGLRWNNDHQFLLCFLRKFIFWRGLSKGLANVSFLTCFLQKDFCNDFVNILDIFSFFFFFFFFNFHIASMYMTYLNGYHFLFAFPQNYKLVSWRYWSKFISAYVRVTKNDTKRRSIFEHDRDPTRPNNK